MAGIKMKRIFFRQGFIIAIFGLATIGSLLVGGAHPQNPQDISTQTEVEKATDIQVPPPPLSEDTYPCTMCHAEMETNFEKRELMDFHDDIVLKHDEDNRWCLDCHDAGNRDMLHLAGGQLISFEESYKLCGQCHGPKLRDWEAGIHGRRIGDWNGQKQYLLCAHCHNPHTPRFPAMKPDPAPNKPGKKK
jgi:hypothetical protein